MVRVQYATSGWSALYRTLVVLVLLAILGIVIAILVKSPGTTAVTTTTMTTTVVPTTTVTPTTSSTPNVACGQDIQAAVNALTEVILTSPCVYNVTSTIFLRSGSILRASPPDRLAVLRLNDGANQPVVLVGNDLEVGTSAPLMTNVVIRDIAIDGNKAAQSSETMPSKPWIRNNGIDVRYVSGLSIDNVYVHDARSGAIVVSWDSSTVSVTNSLLTTR